MLFPELGPRLAWRAAEEDVGMVLALFVRDAFGVAIVAGETALRENLIGLFCLKAKSNDGSRRWCGVAAQPF
jgi:hypothetical protein